ncbi:YaiI/YqxD family protein [Aquibacillus salsiterrae]|uniref:UPF0178 protein NC799_04850 n=1 Tax=Aquibacillus salsiterrae TaxID=2950439 RepID=A0A9X3WB59_9BACI|nr:YaiI/YqxD family protein [Aquibacillus salsiterrae]MDC3416237.1 YaiI/YqxD family protein [Aquibacillus salsiterrae]
MKIYVDADACPVKQEIIAEASLYQLEVVFVKSFSHFSSEPDPDGVKSIYVDAGADAADYRIMKLADKEDIIVTQDYGLASLALGKGCTVIHHKGFQYQPETIDQLLLTRHFSAKARRSGEKTKGPKPFTDHDREQFQQVFHHLLQHVVEQE